MATQKTLNGAAQFAATVFGDEDRTAAGVQISGTFTGTLVFEGSMDSGNTWVPVYGIPVVAGALTAPVNSATAPGNWLFQFGGWTTLRVRASAFSSGSALVWIATNAGLSYQGAAAAGVTALPPPAATVSPSTGRTVDTDFGTVTKKLVKNTAGNVLTIKAWNANAAVRWLLLHNKATAPAAADVPVSSYPIPAGTANSPGSVSLGLDDFGPLGRYQATGIGWSISTTKATFTDAATAADHQVEAEYV